MERRKYLTGISGISSIVALATGGTVAGQSGDTSGNGPPDETPGNGQPKNLPGAPPGGSLHDEDRETITSFLESHVDDETFPGAAVAVVNESEVLYRRAVGKAQIEPVSRELTEETVFDLASMTKTVVTTTAILQLLDQDQIDLKDSICEFYGESLASDHKKCAITVEHLLTHTAGYPAWAPLWQEVNQPDEVIDHVLQEISLEAEPGTEQTYSDLGFILLGDIVSKVSGTPLNEYATEQIFEPLEMDATAFNPLETLPDDLEYAATERSAYYDDEVVVGEVHDEIAAFRGGVSGHAGAFSTIDDLATFARAILCNGNASGTRVLSQRTVNTMTRNRLADLEARRGLGWNLSDMFGESDSGAPFDRNAFGQNGFTGTSIWFAPRMNFAVVTLTNRVHPTRENYGITSFRPEFHNLVATLISS